MRPIKIIAPLGTIVNPVPPAPCAARGLTGFRMMDTLFGALAKVVPDRLPAAGEGGVSFPVIGGWQNGRRFVLAEGLLGTWGGRHGCDGYEGVSNPSVNLTNQPIELIEAQYPIEITRYGMVRNASGPGRWCGGLGLLREYRLLTDEAVLTMRSDRRFHRPYGLFGGYDGTPSLNILNPGPEQKILPVMPMELVQLKRGDVFCHIGAGGGGYGDPLQRDPERVCEDVRDGRITIAYARDVYGVVIDPKTLVIDVESTENSRRGLVQRPQETAQNAALEHFMHEVGVEMDALHGSAATRRR
jgi:N-methylhydantoinase B